MIIMNMKRLCYGLLLVNFSFFLCSLIIGINNSEASNKTTAEITIQSETRLSSDSSKDDYQADGNFDPSKAPEPPPTNSIRHLLQTNEKNSWFLILMGITLIIFVIWKKKKNK